MTRIRYRPFRHGDFDDVADIIGQTWYQDYGDAYGAQAQQLLGEINLATDLRRTTWTQVALVDKELVGFMLARAGNASRQTDAMWKSRADGAHDALHAYNSEVTDMLDGYLRDENRVHEEMQASSDCDQRYEVVTFIVTPESRGHGIGRELFERTEDHLASQGATEFFLYTNKTCNWGFYEHLGLDRAAEYITTDDDSELMHPEYYIYVDKLDGCAGAEEEEMLLCSEAA